ncbi:MAG: hypothetical protein ABIA63_01795 [bacterium]
MEEKLKELNEKIANLPPDGEGWWQSSGEKTFVALGEKLLNKGFSVDEAFDFLDDAYLAVSGEYGG